MGWSQIAWQGGQAPYHQVGSIVPNLNYQITNGALIAGGTRCAVLSTAPEPTGGARSVTRAFPAIGGAAFMSFLIRPLAVGTGTDEVAVMLLAGTNELAAINLKPNLTQTGITVGINGFANTGTFTGPVFPTNTYLVVVHFIRSSQTGLYLKAWVNPPKAMPASGGIGPASYGGASYQAIANFDTVSLRIHSTDTGGPSTSIALDELRVGYTWSDVVPESLPQPSAAPIHIAPAVRIVWQTEASKSYQPQRSYDLTNWHSFGPTILGDGMQKDFFDAANQVPSSFYRVIER